MRAIERGSYHAADSGIRRSVRCHPSEFKLDDAHEERVERATGCEQLLDDRGVGPPRADHARDGRGLPSHALGARDRRVICRSGLGAHDFT